MTAAAAQLKAPALIRPPASAVGTPAAREDAFGVWPAAELPGMLRKRAGARMEVAQSAHASRRVSDVAASFGAIRTTEDGAGRLNHRALAWTADVAGVVYAALLVAYVVRALVERPVNWGKHRAGHAHSARGESCFSFALSPSL